MPPDRRIVTRMPLTELWDAGGLLPLTRGTDVGAETITALLRAGPVRFVVANCGALLDWIPVENRHLFWKGELKPRLVEPKTAETGFRLEDFPGEYCFVATAWGEHDGMPVVVLETHH